MSRALGWGPCFQQLASPATGARFKDMKSQSGNEVMWTLAQLGTCGLPLRVCWATAGETQPPSETLGHAGVGVGPSTWTIVVEFWTCGPQSA